MMDTKRRITEILLCCWFISALSIAYAQPDTGKYTILTYQVDRSNSGHGKIEYLWIVDSSVRLDGVDLLRPLYTEGYSKDQLDRCCKKEEVDVFTMTKDTNYDFDSHYDDEIKKLVSITKRHRRLVTKERRSLQNGNTEIVRLYVTQISGNFCSCAMGKHTGDKLEYHGPIYLPVRDFIYVKSSRSVVADLRKSNFLLSIDFVNTL